MADDTSVSRRTGRDLLRATLPFVEECQRDSWWRVGSTLVVLAVLLACAAVAPWWPLRVAASIVGGLVIVRVFILYHDFLHGALLPGSRLASGLFYSLGLLMLTPPRHWRSSHNFHHAHVGKAIVAQRDAFPIVTSDVGSFPLMSTESWQTATTWQRLRYRTARHPITILCAYVTVFLFIGCVDPLLKNPRKYWDGALSLIVHGGTIALLWACAGFGVVLSAFFLPFVIASALGAYLFYVQHTFEGLAFFRLQSGAISRGARVVQLHEARSDHEMVHGEYRLSPRAPLQSAHRLLPPAGSDGCHTRAPTPGRDVTWSATYWPVSVRTSGISRSSEWSVTAKPPARHSALDEKARDSDLKTMGYRGLFAMRSPAPPQILPSQSVSIHPVVSRKLRRAGLSEGLCSFPGTICLAVARGQETRNLFTGSLSHDESPSQSRASGPELSDLVQCRRIHQGTTWGTQCRGISIGGVPTQGRS